MIAKHTIEIKSDDLKELIIKQLNLNVAAGSVKISAHCSDPHDVGYGMLTVHSVTLAWEDGRDDRWDR